MLQDDGKKITFILGYAFIQSKYSIINKTSRPKVIETYPTFKLYDTLLKGSWAIDQSETRIQITDQWEAI